MSAMAALSLDTHAIVRKLKATGLTEDQAEAITTALRESRDYELTHLATKADLSETKADILKWVIGAIGLQTVAIGFMLKFLH